MKSLYAIQHCDEPYIHSASLEVLPDSNSFICAALAQTRNRSYPEMYHSYILYVENVSWQLYFGITRFP